MPEGTPKPPADGAQDPQAESKGTEGTTTTPPEKTFTQSDVDRIIAERLSRAVPSDYESLKTRAAQMDEFEEAQKTEVQKLQDRAEKAERLAQEAITTANQRIRKAEILAQASAQNATDGDTVYALLADSEDISVDKDGNVLGAEEAVKTLLKTKTFLVKAPEGSPRKSGGEFGGQESKSVSEQIKEAEAKGDWAASRRLKLAKLAR